MADNLPDQLFPQQCGCADCEAAVSPAAYLAALIDYALKHVRKNGIKIDLQFLEDTYHQPFSDLPTDCEAVEKQVRQLRICIEVLRSYLGADSAQQEALAKAEGDYRLATYSLLLSRLGTTYEEIRRIRNEVPENRNALAERLGIDLTLPRFLDPAGDRLDRLFLDPEAQTPASHALTEQVLEQLFGLADTTRDPLSESAKLGDDQGQIWRWNLNDVHWRDNTDRDGTVYVKLIKDLVTNIVRVELYQDNSRTKLVASGEIASDSGTVKLVPQNNSRLSGVVEIVYTYTADSPAISIAAIPAVLSWQLQHLRTLWERQDWPADPYIEGPSQAKLKALPAGLVFPAGIQPKIAYDPHSQVLTFIGVMQASERQDLVNLSADDDDYRSAINALFRDSQRLPIIDPDLIGPDDFRVPIKKNAGEPDKAFDLWLERREWADAALRNLKLAREASGFTIILQQVLGNPLPDLDALLLTLTQGGDPDEINSTKDRIADLYLSVESFSRLMIIRSKDRLASIDDRNEKVSDEEWNEVYSILTQAQKVQKFAEWRAKEQEAFIRLGAEEFWISLREPTEGDWPPISIDGQPLIDPAIVKLTDLTEWKTGKEAIDLWKIRTTRLEQIPEDLKSAREANVDPVLGFDAMLKLALGDPLPHDLDTLKNELSNPETVASATGKITDDLHLTVEGFKQLLLIKAKNDGDPTKRPTAAEWAELYAILTPPRKINHEYPDWLQKEQTANLVYWNALKAKLPRWRATLEARQAWQQALRNRSQNPIIDPEVIGPDDLKHVVAGDPAFDVWKKRYDSLVTLRKKLKSTREDDANKLNGLDTIIKDTLGIEAIELETIDKERQAGHSIEKWLEQLNLTNGSFTYLMRIRGLAKAEQPITESEWDAAYATLAQAWKQRGFTAWREDEREKEKRIILSPDFFKIPKTLTTPLPALSPATLLWLSTWQARRDWQDALQSRIDQENSVIEALRNAVSTVEEATLSQLRNALILASDATGTTLDEQAEWITDRLLIDARSGACQITTRVAQAIETLQLLLFRLRAGLIRERRDWALLPNSPLVRAGSSPYSAPLTLAGTSDHVLVLVGDDNRVYSTFASIMFDGPWSHVGSDTDHTIPAKSTPSLFSFENGGKAYLFATGNDGHINFTFSDSGNGWQTWSPVGDLQLRIDARITVAAAVVDELVHVFVVRDNGQIHGNWWDGQWHDWTRIGNEAFSIPTNAILGAASSKNEVHLFVAGNDGKIYTSQVNRNIANDWAAIGAAGTVAFLPGAAVTATGTSSGDAFVELVAVAKDGEIYRTSWNEMTGDWTAWAREGTLTVSREAVVTMTGDIGNLQLFVVGRTGGIYWKANQDWEQIGNTTVTAGAVVASRLELAGAQHLYINKRGKVLTTSRSAVGAPWNLTVLALTLEASQFDEEWQWIGSYATWRAAMLVFLYPENILQPSLREKRQTPAFDTLVTNTRLRLDPDSACMAAKNYADYFRDVCSLQIKATCQALTQVHTGNNCQANTTEERYLFYMFGWAPSGRVYWSAYDPLDSSGYAQSFWQEVPLFKEVKILSVVGAMPYEQSELVYPQGTTGDLEVLGFRVFNRNIYLFCVTEDKNGLASFEFVKFNLDTFGFVEEKDNKITPLKLEGFGNITSLKIVPVQTSSPYEAPSFVFHQEGNTGKGLYLRKLNEAATDWDNSGSGWDKYKIELQTYNNPSKPPGKYGHLDDSYAFRFLGLLHAAYKFKGKVFIAYTDSTDDIAISPISDEDFVKKALFLGEGTWLGVLPGASHSTPSTPLFQQLAYVFYKTSAQTVYQKIDASLSVDNKFATISDLKSLVPHSGSAPDGQQVFAFQRSKNKNSYYYYRYRELDDQLVGSSIFRAVPRVVSPLDIPERLSSNQLQDRRQAIKNAFALNSDATPSVLTYLQEAYYFVPIHLALQLQSAGQYIAALDWFRTVYDYEAKIGERTIYYGLELDAAMPDASLFQQAGDWLLDPLNPHLIAATRRYAYTRFTIMSLARCLLDFADAEFTQETVESLARARTLYLTALDLLNLPELQQKLGACEDLIGELQVEPGKDIPPEVPVIVGEIKEELSKGGIFNFSTITSIVTEINLILLSDVAWEARLVEAKAVVQNAVVNASSPLSTGAIVAAQPSVLKEQYSALLTQPTIDFTAQAVGKAAAAQFFNGIGQPEGVNHA